MYNSNFTICTAYNVDTRTPTHWVFANIAYKKVFTFFRCYCMLDKFAKVCNYQKVAGSLEQFQYVLYEEILIHVNTNLDSRILNVHYVLVKVKPKALFWAFALIRVPKN